MYPPNDDVDNDDDAKDNDDDKMVTLTIPRTLSTYCGAWFSKYPFGHANAFINIICSDKIILCLINLLLSFTVNRWL